MATILITGGTGTIGKVLTKALVKKGYQVIILTRSRSVQNEPGISYAVWDVNRQIIEREAVSKADHIIHLAGANVADKRWTETRKKEIADSRVKSAELLIRTLKETNNRVQSLISSSAIGWYGPDPVLPNPRPFIETDPADNSFLGQTCLQWENSLAPVIELGKRLVKIRTGIVIDKEAGVVKEFSKPLKFGLATILGSGRQIMSWIHVDDLVRMYIEAIENSTFEGAYNGVAPHPVSNKELVLALARTQNKFYIPVHVPAFVLKIVLGEMSIEVLKSATVSSKRIEQTGFMFQYPELKQALASL
jgi:uncharacterized protein (TIGR01777 family)